MKTSGIASMAVRRLIVRRLIGVVMALCCASVGLGASPEDASSHRDPLEALRHLRTAAVALGGEDHLRETASLELLLSGTLSNPGQGLAPGRPFDFSYRWQGYFDWDTERLTVATESADLESGAVLGRSATVQELTADGLSQAMAAALSPHAVVRHLLARPNNLVLLDDNAIAGPLYGHVVRLSFAPDGTPRSLRYHYTDPVRGDSVRVVEYLNYTAHGDWLAPRRVRRLDAGHVFLDLAVDDVRAGGVAPDWTTGVRAAAVSDTPPGRLSSVELAAGIHVIELSGPPNYRAMIVELDDALLLLEAPERLGDGTELRQLAATLSEKPIAFVVPTHHHVDHSAGAAIFAAQGAEVLTTPGNVGWFTDMVGSSRLLQNRPAPATRPRVRALAPGERIGPVQFLDAGPSGHADEHLVFYFPDQRLLFQSDMAFFNDDGSVQPASTATCALVSFVERENLAIDIVVNAHGRRGVVDDLHRALALREEPCP